MRYCYLRHKDAGGQFFSRVVTGNNYCTLGFSISPWYFDLAPEEEEALEVHLCNSLDNIHISEATWSKVRKMFAHLVYHCGFLSENSPSHLVFQQPIFTNILSQVFAHKCKTLYPWNYGPKFPSLSGIPPHVNLLSKIAEVLLLQKELPDKAVGVIVEELDIHGVTGPNM